MHKMRSKKSFKVDFDWIGPIPTDDRLPGENKGHFAFFIYCVWCDRWCDNHLLKCNSEDKVSNLFAAYAKRLENILPFKMHIQDFQIIAKNTWNDPEYQHEKQSKRRT